MVEMEGQNQVISFRRFLGSRLLRFTQTDLVQLVLSHPACDYSPLMVQSRTKDQLISYLMRVDPSRSFASLGGSGNEETSSLRGHE